MRSEWYVMVDDERGTLRLEFNRRKVFLHLLLRKPLEGMRACREQMPALKKMLRAIGYRMVNVIIPEGDAKLYRFEEMFGFREVRRVGGQILMAQEC